MAKNDSKEVNVKRIKKSLLDGALGHERNGIVAIGLPDGTLKCSDIEVVDLKAGSSTIPGFRVKSMTGRWFSIYLFSLISDIPFQVDGQDYIVPDSFNLVSKNNKLLITV